MQALLDTHLALWALTGSEKLPCQAAEIIADESNDVFYSIASVWEVALKHASHPDMLPMPPESFCAFCKKSGYALLGLQESHVLALDGLRQKPGSTPHNDPFDRILLAQAKAEGLAFVTHDPKIAGYDEPCVLFVP